MSVKLHRFEFTCAPSRTNLHNLLKILRKTGALISLGYKGYHIEQLLFESSVENHIHNNQFLWKQLFFFRK